MWGQHRQSRKAVWADRRTCGVRDRDAQAGMSTAEYAVGTIAAAGFAAVLYKIVTSGPVSTAMRQLIERALDAGF
ncbi:DUF4244 domain-containing protein [Streptomyces sp. CNQ085]|nr:DUF4244 domain-containing protein [Streptomyces sp. CNQ085]